jgi:phosphatidylglycerophosphatase C
MKTRCPKQPAERIVSATLRALVVFDMDGTLVHGDSGSLLIHHLIGQRLWRRAFASLLAPIGFPLMAIPATRRVGVSIFFWIATVGMSEAQLETAVDAFMRLHRPQRIEPVIAALQSELDAGNDVVVATGAFQALAERLIKQLQLRGAPRVVGSTIRRSAGGFVSHIQANGPSKLRRLAECGLQPPFDRAWSDSRSDLPLLHAAREAHWVTLRSSAPESVLARLPGLIVHTIVRD